MEAFFSHGIEFEANQRYLSLMGLGWRNERDSKEQRSPISHNHYELHGGCNSHLKQILLSIAY